MANENKQFNKNNIIKEKPKSLNWFNKNKFKEILAIIDSNEFSYGNKIVEFKYANNKDLVDNIKNNTISEIDAWKDLNKLKEIRNVEKIKYKKRTPRQKKILNLFNNLSNIILTDKTLASESQVNENENEKVESRKEENEDDDYKYGNEDENDCYENEDEDETMSQKIIKNLNDNLDEIIDKSKSFEDQIKSLKKIRRCKRVFTL